VGADAISLLARRHDVSLRAEPRTQASSGQALLGDKRLALAVPHTYMNESGIAAQALTRRYGIEDPARVVIVHDELDLPVGTVRVKCGGGTAGHNGLKSVDAHLHSLDFVRVRIGIGRPPGRMSGADYVLRRPGRADSEILDAALELAADAVESVLSAGPDAAMNAINGR